MVYKFNVNPLYTFNSKYTKEILKNTKAKLGKRIFPFVALKTIL